jgi:molecular chaperone GrpE
VNPESQLESPESYEEEISTLKAALESAEQAGAAARDAQLRALAELDNVRKRAQRDIESAQRFAL